MGAAEKRVTTSREDRPKILKRTPAAEAEFLSVEEAAELLRVNRGTLYEAVKRGEVPGIVKIGRILRIRRSALLAVGGDTE